MAQCMLTTVDNPFDPFEEFEKWDQFDRDKQYNSCALLDRISNESDQLTDNENEEERERAINEIIKYDFLNIYKKVTKSD